MKRALENIILVSTAVILSWPAASTVEVLAKNANQNPTYSKNNFYVRIFGQDKENIYPLAVTVSDLIEEEDVVVFTDNNGFNWEWSEIEDWQVEDTAALLMDTNGTETIYDDIILTANYCG